MKHTLLLLALTSIGCSLGATLNTEFDVTSSTTTPITLTGMSDSSFSLVTTLNVQFLQSYMAGAKTQEKGYVLISATSGSLTLGVAFDTLSDNNTYLGTTTLSASNDYQSIANTTNYWKIYTGIGGTDGMPGFVNSQISWSDVKYASLTMVHNNTSNTQLYLAVGYDDGRSYILAGTQGNLKWSSGISPITGLDLNTDAITSVKVYDGAFTTTAAIKETLINVPEATTTSLSLLALMGLAARRRRKSNNMVR